MARGEFDHLEGEGKPIPNLEDTYDPDWWVRSWLRRNGYYFAAGSK